MTRHVYTGPVVRRVFKALIAVVSAALAAPVQASAPLRVRADRDTKRRQTQLR